MGGRGANYFAIQKHKNSTDDNPFDFKNDSKNDFIDDKETQYKNEMFHKLKDLGISVRESTDDIDDKIFERQETAVYNIARKYQKILSKTTRTQDIQLGGYNPGKDGCMGYCEPDIKDGKIIQRVVVNKAYLKDYDEHIKVVEYGIKNKHFADANIRFNGRDYILTHEMGHAIENSIFESIREKHNMQLSANDYVICRKEWGKRIKNEVKEIWQNKYTTGKENDKLELSKYSKKTEREWFAETFTNLQLADKPAPIALALDEYLRRELYGNI